MTCTASRELHRLEHLWPEPWLLHVCLPAIPGGPEQLLGTPEVQEGVQLPTWLLPAGSIQTRTGRSARGWAGLPGWRSSERYQGVGHLSASAPALTALEGEALLKTEETCFHSRLLVKEAGDRGQTSYWPAFTQLAQKSTRPTVTEPQEGIVKTPPPPSTANPRFLASATAVDHHPPNPFEGPGLWTKCALLPSCG